MQIGELARRAEITLRTVRYYEALGLIRHTVKTKGGFRLYGGGELRKLELIRDLHRLDIPLATIREMFFRKEGARSGADLAAGVRETLGAQLQDIEGRMARYQAMRAAVLETMEMVRGCAECELRPGPEVCGACPVVTGRPEVPLPMRALISVA